MTTKVPGIQAPTQANLLAVAKSIKGLLDVREGHIGDKLDAFVTFRDLIDSGLATRRPGSGNSQGSQQVLPPWVDNDGYDPLKDFAPPPKPVNFTATGLFAVVQLQWDTPAYRNHAYTEIWRGETNTIGNAILIGTSETDFYVDNLGASATRYYWVRHVSQADVKGPYNAVDGVQASTATDPALVLASLTGQIRETHLYQSLGDRINLIDGPISLAGSVAARVYAEEQARLAADTSLGSSITTLQNTTATQATQITSLQTRATTSESNIINLQNTTASQATSITSLTTRTTAAESNITSLQTTTSNQASSITSLTTRVGTAESNITNLQTTTSNQATSISQLTTSVNGNTTSIQTLTTTTNGLSGQYTVKVDNNGYVSGFGLASTATNAAPFSDFAVRADRFYIANPAGPGIAPAMPFIVQTTPTNINGVDVPVGVYIADAFIRNGTINSAKIANAAIDNAKIASLDAAKITTGFLSANRISAGSITADKIDSRNLTIKDSAGNIIFSASGTSYLNVTGLGSLATKNSVSASSDVTGLGTLATKNSVSASTEVTGLGNFAFANQINTGNVSTYIAAGAIGNAYIGNFISSTNFDGSIDSTGNIINYGLSGWAIGKAGNAAFNSVRLRGEINGGAYTHYGWPAAGQTGFHLGPAGLLIGNVNNGSWFQASSDGFVSMPGLTVSGGTLNIGNGKFVANSDGTVYADLVDVRRRQVLESGSLDSSTVIIGTVPVTMVDSGKSGGSYVSMQPAPAGTVFTGQIIEVVESNIYDYNIFNTLQNQPYYVACSFTGAQFRDWSGSSGATFQLMLTGQASIYRAYSNSNSFPNDYRVVMRFDYKVKLVSGSFNSFRVPLITWSLFKL